MRNRKKSDGIGKEKGEEEKKVSSFPRVDHTYGAIKKGLSQGITFGWLAGRMLLINAVCFHCIPTRFPYWLADTKKERGKKKTKGVERASEPGHVC